MSTSAASPKKKRERSGLAQRSFREVDALAHVVRAFENPVVPHPAGSVDRLRDAEDLNLELMLADLDQITRRLERSGKRF